MDQPRSGPHWIGSDSESVHRSVLAIVMMCDWVVLQIMNELTSNGIHIYQCPTDDETVAEVNTAMNVSLLAGNDCHLTLLRETVACGCKAVVY